MKFVLLSSVLLASTPHVIATSRRWGYDDRGSEISEDETTLPRKTPLVSILRKKGDQDIKITPPNARIESSWLLDPSTDLRYNSRVISVPVFDDSWTPDIRIKRAGSAPRPSVLRVQEVATAADAQIINMIPTGLGLYLRTTESLNEMKRGCVGETIHQMPRDNRFKDALVFRSGRIRVGAKGATDSQEVAVRLDYTSVSVQLPKTLFGQFVDGLRSKFTDVVVLKDSIGVLKGDCQEIALTTPRLSFYGAHKHAPVHLEGGQFMQQESDGCRILVTGASDDKMITLGSPYLSRVAVAVDDTKHTLHMCLPKSI